MEYPKFTPKQDGRVKILPSQHNKVRKLHKKLQSSRKVARIFGVDKGTILNILNPTKYKEKQRKRYEQKPWLDEYQKHRGEEWNKTMRKHRAKKYSLQPDEYRKYRHHKRGKIHNEIPCAICGTPFLPVNTKQKCCPRRLKPCYWKYYKLNKTL